MCLFCLLVVFFSLSKLKSCTRKMVRKHESRSAKRNKKRKIEKMIQTQGALDKFLKTSSSIEDSADDLLNEGVGDLSENENNMEEMMIYFFFFFQFYVFRNMYVVTYYCFFVHLCYHLLLFLCCMILFANHEEDFARKVM
ncbi:unnamed protein product [Prunus armeniaca]